MDMDISFLIILLSSFTINKTESLCDEQCLTTTSDSGVRESIRSLMNEGTLEPVNGTLTDTPPQRDGDSP